MKNTKIIAFTAALSLMGALFTACGRDTGTAEETTTSAASSEATVSSSEAVSESTLTETEEFAEDENGAAAEENLNLQFSETENPLRPLIETMVSSGEWPYLSEITDEQIISDYLTLDKNNENYEQAIYMQCPMSASLTEIIIIKAADVEAAKADLESRQKKAQETDAFYPADIERANGSIVGTEGNYAYFIMSSNASEAETVLVEAIREL